MPVIHHIGYVVVDLRSGVEAFARDFGAGPFFVMEHLEFDEVTYQGGPAVYDHSSGFGAWGPILVELTQVHDAQPAGLAGALTAPGAGIGHVAWLADDLDAEVQRLQAAGSVRSTPAGPARRRPSGSTAGRRSATRSRCCSAATRSSASTPWSARRPRAGTAPSPTGSCTRRRHDRGPRPRVRPRRRERGDRRP